MTDFLPFAIFIALVAIAINLAVGIHIGILIQTRRDYAALDQLAAENRQLRKRLAATLCRYRAKSQAVKRLQHFVDRNWYGEVGEVDEYLMRDRSGE